MATMYYDQDADLSLIQGKKVAVIGYGSQGHAHALNLKDSGVSVKVGLPAASRSRAKAQAAGLEVGDVADGRRSGPTSIMVLVPDTTAAKVYREAIEPNLAPGKMLMFAHGFNIRFGTVTPRADVDVTMIAPKSPGHRVRELYVEGAGTPALDRRPPGRDRPGQGAGAVVRQGHRRHARRRHRDDVRRGDRNRSVRRAGGAVRRRQRAGQGRLRHARRRRLSAGGRVLRVPPRAEADRRSDLSGRPELHALLGERHRRARRLHRRPAHRDRRDPEGDEEDARGDPQRPVRAQLDRGERVGPPVVRGHAPRRSGRAGSRRSAPSCAR